MQPDESPKHRMWIGTGRGVLTLISGVILFLAAKGDDPAASITAGVIMVAVLWGIAYVVRTVRSEAK